ncbi:hypothetical protein [Nonomuraea sp. NPDC050643]|uniref:hypothetical protein n=1 Tax=Nonomuraea sp. NPDC050643 TaxID=3155660 RepID=UPI0033D53193
MSKLSVPALSVLAILLPLAPAAIEPTGPTAIAGAAVAAVLVVPAVVLRRRRWVLRVSAALLFLLAASAFAPPLTGLGRPSREEIITSFTIDRGRRLLDDAASTFPPFDDNALLLLGAAFAASAGALLGGARSERGAVPPIRWRTSLALWGAALVLVSVPYAMALLFPVPAPAAIGHGMVAMEGDCLGFGAYQRLGPLLSPLLLLPQPVVVAAGFAVWAPLAMTCSSPP